MSGLFDQLTFDGAAARNRIVRAATAESLATGEGCPSERLVSLYEGLAHGGAGTIITGYSYFLPDGKPSEHALSFCDGRFEKEYRQLVDSVHSHGALIVLQLVYGGSKSKLTTDDPRRISPANDESQSPNVRIVGPSAVRHPSTGLVPHDATLDDLGRIAKGFADAAARARQWGFDGVEIHVAHGYLLSQFLSPHFNRREDRYGGSLVNRARFACECVSSARLAAGDGFPIFAKLNSSDTRDGTSGLVESDSIAVAQMLVDAGASAIEVTGDWHSFTASDAYDGPFFGEFGKQLAEKIDVPVVVTGGWRDPRKAEKYLSSSSVAAIGMSRPLICEPDLPSKWREGKLFPARCTSCNHCLKQPGIPCVFHKAR